MSPATVMTHTRPLLKRPRAAFCATRPDATDPTPARRHLLRATLISALATAAAQFVGVPLDVASKSPLFALLRSRGPQALYRGLPMHLLKRTPTKALTVLLFESLRGDRVLSRVAHVRTALVAGCCAMAATYPLHTSYYSWRKGIALRAVAARARAGPAALYAGFIPGLLAVAPAVLVDVALYSSVRAQLVAARRGHGGGHAKGSGGGGVDIAALAAAAALSNVAAGAFAEPLKAVSRRAAVAALSGAPKAAAAGIARQMLAKGPGEFWRGFPLRSLRYACSAVVSKVAVQRLREADAGRRGREAHVAKK